MSRIETVAKRLAALLFSDMDARVYLHGYNRGWHTFEEVTEMFANVLREAGTNEQE